MRKRIAFTLAEVLITLGIIGVIAALLLHNIGINITKKEIATKVKKNYAILNQTIDRAEADYGDTANWEYKSYEELETWVKTYILPYVQYSKFCNESCNLGGYHFLGYNPKNNNANPRIPRYTIILNNGSIWTFYRSQGRYSHQTKIVVYVGKPITKARYWYAGIDAFSFIFDSEETHPHIRPFQVPSTSNGAIYYPNMSRATLLSKQTQCGCATNFSACYGYNVSGDYCSMVLLMDNWEFKKDYPWKRY